MKVLSFCGFPPCKIPSDDSSSIGIMKWIAGKCREGISENGDSRISFRKKVCGCEMFKEVPEVTLIH